MANELRHISTNKLQKILKKHKEWIDSGTKKGEKANLSGENLIGANLSGADLSGANLSEADLIGANLSEADLSETDLNRSYLIGASLSEADLSNTNLFGANLSDTNLFGANLSEADLIGAYLIGANLSEADLIGANLSEANLSEADLIGANLSEADLSEADLSHTNLNRADLNRADLNRANLGWTIFADVDLREVKGLESVNHRGPSSIGIDTIYRSQGKIPEVFLRGCGVPDNFIEYMHSLTGSAIEFYSCFISYSSKDQDFAQRLHEGLQANGVRCWFAPEDMKIGDKIRQTITDSIRVHDKLLLILSNNSVESEWVEKEVETAFKEERQRKTNVLFPVRLDEAVMETNQAWAEDIYNSRHIGDFTNWKDHDSYQKGFDRLLRDLKA